jgi:hypothetical protein
MDDSYALPDISKDSTDSHHFRIANGFTIRVPSTIDHQPLTIDNKLMSKSPLITESTWLSLLDDVRARDIHLFRRIVRKMIIHLRRLGVPGSAQLQDRLVGTPVDTVAAQSNNSPRDWKGGVDELVLVDEVFNLAHASVGEIQVRQSVEKWIQEDRSSFLLKTLSTRDAPLEDVAMALEQFITFSSEGLELSPAIHTGLKCDLIRRFLTDELDYINSAKEFVEIADFHDLVQHTIAMPGSRGKLGGKAAGIFLGTMALTRSKSSDLTRHSVMTPKTWFIASDAFIAFINHNNLEEIVEQKYKEIWQVKVEYDHIIQLFKSSRFPQELEAGIAFALDDLGSTPIVVRSSSLLEDRRESAFSGKYKSLFLANQGSRADRLSALLDAVAEVYASLFGPDPMEYRGERGLLDFHEEMGIIIQQVVGTKVGNYFLPAYSGVIFSHNEFRWSPRIKREDGLVRIVAGLGTRAVDRLGDDYPIMFAPGQPSLRINVTAAEAIRYAPKKLDVINLKTNRFETVPVRGFLKKYGVDLPMFHQILSLVKEDHLRLPSPFLTDLEAEDPLITFEGLISKTSFVERVVTMTRVLKDRLGTPVDIEFASDGNDFYLLQCRPQAFGESFEPSIIPRSVPEGDLLFTANRFVSNGHVRDITHIVYVDPAAYGEIPDKTTMFDVGRAVGVLNRTLPRRQFILMGPGRWGSRGDIKLGVSITYADISNTAMLIEIARRRGNYVPDLSFGTHFFQDLVESAIRYLPLFPDDPAVHFNESLLRSAHNRLAEYAAEYSHLSDVVHVIDLPSTTNGKILDVMMNGELDEAVAVLTVPTGASDARKQQQKRAGASAGLPGESHWRWRLEMAERIAQSISRGEMGLRELYLFGSVKNATSGPSSDIDLIAHVTDKNPMQKELERWFEGWSLGLDEMNFQRTGSRRGGLLHMHYVTDQDVLAGTTFGQKIRAETDPARRLPLRVTAGEKV